MSTELRRLLDEATPGPWRQGHPRSDDTYAGETHVAETWHRVTQDAALIVAAVNALPRYLDLAEAVRDWRAAWKVIDDTAAGVERRRVVRERMFAALDALDAAREETTE